MGRELPGRAMVCQITCLTVFQACATMKWENHERSQVVQTSWAIMALIYAQYPHRKVFERGTRLVMERQLPVSDASRLLELN
jgi:squalene cyclase